uniref:Uncharacterized protein n=1 Tax=Tetranychus urticae TaxID=32264 RepID=T1L0J7_TETUR
MAFSSDLANWLEVLRIELNERVILFILYNSPLEVIVAGPSKGGLHR